MGCSQNKKAIKGGLTISQDNQEYQTNTPKSKFKINDYKYLTLIMILFIFTTVMGINLWIAQQQKETTLVSETFITSILKQDYGTAGNVARGKLLWQLSNMEDAPECEVILVKSQVLSQNKNLAKTFTICEFKTGGRTDVAWYEIYLIKDAEKWEVYKINENMPEYDYNIYEYIQKEPDLPLASTSVVEGFIHDTTSGKDCSIYLAGPALQMYEQIPPGDINEKVESINITPLYYGDKIITCKATYTLRDKQLNAMITLYKLDKWKITSVVQL